MFQLRSGKEIEPTPAEFLIGDFPRAWTNGLLWVQRLYPLKSGRECEQSHTSDTWGWCDQTRFYHERPCFWSRGTYHIHQPRNDTRTTYSDIDRHSVDLAMGMAPRPWLKHGQVVDGKIVHLESVMKRMHFE